MTAKDIELYASGYEAPAEEVLKEAPVSGLFKIPQNPDGLPLTIRLL